MKKIMTRQAAIAAGLKTYFTGKPCPKGHIAERRVTGCCVVCSNQYNAVWRTADPEANKARVKSWKDSNPDRVKEHNVRGHKKVLEDQRKREAANEKSKAWAKANPEIVRARVKAWKKDHPDRAAATRAMRRAAQLKRTPAWADRKAILMIYRAAGIARVTWPEIEVHVDHILPLLGKTVSGLHVHRNLRIVPKASNLRKSNHFEGH